MDFSFGLWLLGFVLRGLGIGFWTLSFGLQVKVSVYYAIAQNPKSLDFGLGILAFGLLTLHYFRLSTLTFEL